MSTRQDQGKPEESVSQFGRQTGTVRRSVTVHAPPQVIGGQRHAVKITALALGDLPGTLTKGTDKATLLGPVFHPEVRSVVNGEVIYAFDPPLRITVEYTDEDRAAAERMTGNPHGISLITVWRDDSGAWRWERLATTVDAKTRTMTAEVANLNPRDPVAQGVP